MLERIIRRTEDLIKQFSVAALAQPQDKTQFGYGHAVGYIQGLRSALEIMEGELKDEKRADSERP